MDKKIIYKKIDSVARNLAIYKTGEKHHKWDIYML